MDKRVVCISRTLAAGGESIGQAVAQRLGFRYIDEQIIDAAAQMAQVEPAVVKAAEHRQPLLQRVVDRLSRGVDLAATVVPLEVFVPSAPEYRADTDDLRMLIRAAIHDLARVGSAVIVAHAASFALTGVEGALRVLVTASPDIRAQRLAVARRIDEAEATKAIADSDRERRDYLRTFYQVKEEMPTHYDLVVNTDALPFDRAVEAIITAQSRRA
jgi:CMP/dCMP kinase